MITHDDIINGSDSWLTHRHTHKVTSPTQTWEAVQHNEMPGCWLVCTLIWFALHRILEVRTISYQAVLFVKDVNDPTAQRCGAETKEKSPACVYILPTSS